MEFDLTGYAKFPKTFTKVVKLYDSIAIITENELLYCNPWDVDRELMGIFNISYKHSTTINSCCLIYIPSSFAAGLVENAFTYHDTVDLNMLVLDDAGNLVLFDIALQYVICTVKLPVEEKIIKLMQSKNVGEFLVLSDTMLGTWKFENLKLVSQVKFVTVRPNSIVNEFCGKYLILNNGTIFAYDHKKYEIFYSKAVINDFYVWRNRVLCIKELQSEGTIKELAVHLINGASIGIRSEYFAHDFYDHYFVFVDRKNLMIINMINPKNNIHTKSLPSTKDESCVNSIVAGINQLTKMLVVLLFYDSFYLFQMDIPLSALE